MDIWVRAFSGEPENVERAASAYEHYLRRYFHLKGNGALRIESGMVTDENAGTYTVVLAFGLPARRLGAPDIFQIDEHFWCWCGREKWNDENLVTAGSLTEEE